MKGRCHRVLLCFAHHLEHGQADRLGVIALGFREVAQPEAHLPVVGLGVNRDVVQIHTNALLA